MSEKLKVGIVGGKGAMGNLTNEMLQRQGHETIICERDLDTGESNPPLHEIIQNADIVIFSVWPDNQIPGFITNNIDHFRPGQIVLENASSKNDLIESLELLDQKGVSVGSIHPMFKEDQPLPGQKVLIMNVGNNSQKAIDFAKQIHESEGVIAVPFSIKDHDTNMAVIQFVPHLVMRAMAETFVDIGVDLEKVDPIASANFTLFALSLMRTIVQNPRISASIISQNAKEEIAQQFLKKFVRSLRRTFKNTDESKLTASFEKTTQRLSSEVFRNEMNRRTIKILERLARLKVQSITIEVNEDKTGILRQILLPFETAGISLTAIDSHKSSNGTVQFSLGIDRNTVDEDKLRFVVGGLKTMNFTVIS